MIKISSSFFDQNHIKELQRYIQTSGKSIHLISEKNRSIDKFEEITDNLINQYFAKENSSIYLLGEFVNDRSKKLLTLIKENKDKIKVVDNLKDADDCSKILLLISLDNLSKRKLLYVNKFLKII